MTIHSENKEEKHPNTTLYKLAYNVVLETYRKEQQWESYIIARVISEHKERYRLSAEEGVFDAEIIGNIRYTANSRADFPVVGDWVACTSYGADKLLIHKIFPRYGIIKRKAIAQFKDEQIIATNVDYGMIVQAINRDYNLNRIERYLTICNDAYVTPLLIISKIDLIDATTLQAILQAISERMPSLVVIPISNLHRKGIQKLREHIKEGKTYALLGSSGVGKSSLINNLLGTAQMKTGDISTTNDRGKHLTSHRELFVLDSGGIFIDNPGMRALGMGDFSTGIDQTFDHITTLSKDCKYQDCSHIHESNCAVLKALQKGELDKNSYHNYTKLLKEKAHYENDHLAKRKKGKAFSKMVKQMKKKK